MLTLIILIPLLVAAFAALLMPKNSKYIKYVALIASIITFLLIAAAYFSTATTQSILWFSFSSYQFPITTSTMPLNMLLLLIVGIMTPLIIIYSMGFMNLPSEQSRYYFELCMFAAAMLLFAMSGDFITMFIGWELLGVTSYLLIGFWYQRDGTAQAARKAITTILIGDILMLFAMILIWTSYNTFSFAALIQQATAVPSSTMALALVFIMAAVFTKSAQFPFNEWLSDAMKGPTPVSAFLHSSTMVKAGVFLVAVLLPLFVAYHLLYLLIIFGFITAIIGATNAFTEFHIKKILAYSTMEDLGLMFVALGTGSILAAMMLFVVQTFYKALLFMSAGSIMTANNYEEDINKIYNSPSYFTLFLPTLIGVASFAGLYPLSGFFGKAALDMSTSNIAIYLLLLVIGFVSNLYIFRWLLVPLRKKNDKKTARTRGNYKTIPKPMIIAMYTLSVLLIGAYVVYPYLSSYLSPYGSQTFTLSIIEIAITTALFAAALVTSYYLFYVKNFSFSDKSIMQKLLHNNFIINTFYLYVTKVIAFASKIIEELDYSIYNVIKDAGIGVNKLGNLLKKLENGDTNTYIAAFVIGLIIIVAIFIIL
jgi:NADH-quinone oxidoreductase subunit L